MSKRERLSDQAIEAFVASHPGWEREGGAVAKTFAFEDYPGGIAFAVRVGFAAEKWDHHPDLHVGYRKVKVSWSTHDAGGITELDVRLAEAMSRIAGSFAAAATQRESRTTSERWRKQIVVESSRWLAGFPLIQRLNRTPPPSEP